MDMQELLKQAKKARKSGQQDAAIRLCTEVIKQSSDDQDIVKAYLLRGEAYSMKGNRKDYEDATKDLSKVIDLIDETKLDESEYKFYLAKAYLLRGESERNLDNLSLAIKDCTKVIDEINLASEFLTAYAYYIRGMMYGVKNDLDRAVEDFTKFIDLAETVRKLEYEIDLEKGCLMRGELEVRRGRWELAIKDSEKVIDEIQSKSKLSQQDDSLLVSAYTLCGAAYNMGEKYESAIQNFNEAIQLNPDDREASIAYRSLGYAYYYSGNYDKTFDNFKKSCDLDSNNALNTYDFFSYFFQQSKKIEESQRRQLFRCLAPFYKIIEDIRNKAFQRKETVVHYTSALTTASLVEKKGRFRLYHTSMMNDSEEGRILFKIMGDNADYYRRKFYEEGNSPDLSFEAYIGSFMSKSNRDVLLFWRLYGKNNDHEAEGCCLIYPARMFSESPPSVQLPFSKTEMSEPLLDTSSNRPVAIRHEGIAPKTEEISLFSVFYEDTEEVKDLTTEIGEIKTYLGKILEMREQCEYSSHRLFINACVCGLLDNVRFLFKSKHYREEREFRIIKLHFPHSPKVKTEVADSIPHLYMELDKNFRPEEIVLGPRMKNSDAWATFIRHFGISKVNFSKVPFRG